MKEKAEPKLTRVARQISADVAALPPESRAHVEKVIAGLMTAVFGMNKLPKSIEKGLWKIVGDYMQEAGYEAIASKFRDTPPSTIWPEIQAGMSDDLKKLIGEAMPRCNEVPR